MYQLESYLILRVGQCKVKTAQYVPPLLFSTHASGVLNVEVGGSIQISMVSIPIGIRLILAQ